jgi:hypothetical protein
VAAEQGQKDFNSVFHDRPVPSAYFTMAGLSQKIKAKRYCSQFPM